VKALLYRNKVISECQLKDGIERFENRNTCADWSTQLLCGIQLAAIYAYLHIDGQSKLRIQLIVTWSQFTDSQTIQLVKQYPHGIRWQSAAVIVYGFRHHFDNKRNVYSILQQ